MSRLSIDAPLVGRGAELHALDEALTAAQGGRPNAVLLAGDAGAGKTRLVQAFAEHARERSALVLLGHCVDFGAAGLPYLAFAEAIGAQLSASGDAVPAGLSTLLGTPGPPGVRTPPESTRGPGGPEAYRDTVGDSSAVEVGRLQLFEAVARYVGSLSERSTVVLVLEDLHWADASSRDLLRYLLGRMRRERVLIVASYRSDDLHRSHPVRGLLGDLARLPHVRRVEIAPFDLPGMSVFLSALSQAPVPASTVRRILRRSEGNAYFAEELFAAGDRAGVPDGLAEVLLERLERLGSAARQVARIAAVGGRRVGDGLLLTVSGLGRAELDEALREAVSAMVLRAEGERYAFRHALLQEAVYADLLPGERSRWHSAYAAALAASGRHDLGSAAELAHHAMAAHDLPTALAASVRAAEEATELLAPREALAHLERAIELYDLVPGAGDLTGLDAVELYRRAAGYANRCGLLDRAVALARAALRRADEAGDDAQVALLNHRMAQHLIGAERREDALEHARLAVSGYEALVARGAPVVERDRVWAQAGLARALTLTDRPEARASAEEAHAAAVRLGAPDIEADTLATLAVVRSDEDVPADVVDARLVQALVRAREAADVLTELRASVNLAWSRYDRGDVARALEVLEAACDRAEQTGLRWNALAVELRVLRRVARYVSGRWVRNPDAEGDLAPDAAAARLAAAATYVLVGVGDAGAEAALQRLVPARDLDLQVQLGVDGGLAELRRWQGRPEDAADVARAAADDLVRTYGRREPGLLWLAALEVASLADVAEEARLRHDGDAVAGLRARAQERVAVATATLQALVGHRQVERREAGPEARAWLARARAELSRFGAGDGVDPTGPADPVTAWRDARAAFGFGYPYEQARCSLGLAEALLSGSGRGSEGWREAGRLLQEAAAVAEGLGARPLAERVATLSRRAGLGPGPGAADAGPGAVHLTARETDVLRLVAQGWTNRRVGAALFISEKTVSVHLSNVMAKLGASGRTDAVSRAHRAGLLSPLG